MFEYFDKFQEASLGFLSVTEATAETLFEGRETDEWSFYLHVFIFNFIFGDDDISIKKQIQ